MATLRMSLAHSTGKPGKGVVRGQWVSGSVAQWLIWLKFSGHEPLATGR